jgi:5-methyltetrahydrofolate--homocysteine methyltransferase
MPKGVCPEEWILDNPDSIIEIQKGYIEAGSDIVYAPTFGGNRIKLEEFGLENRLEEINTKLVEISKEAVGDKGYVFGDLAPTGRFVEPFGDLLFEEAVEVFKEQVKVLYDAGVDGFVIETMLDIQESRAALLAVKETCDLPVMVSITFGAEGVTLNGTDPLSALITLQALGADAIGCNCSTGPGDMLKIIEAIKPYATVPLLAKPNAGMPKLKDGVTVFDMEPDEFAGFVDDFIAAGVNIFGGCCGTTPDHIAAAFKAAKNKKPKEPLLSSISALSSTRKTHLLAIDKPFTVIGERINPTGKKALQADLREGSLNTVKTFAMDQEQKGAHILDVNMGLSGISEKDMMIKSINLLSKISPLPLCIDTTRLEVIEAALRIYPGRALVNSISAESDRIEETLPIAAKYGAMIIALPLDDKGIPKTLDGRKKAVSAIFDAASKLGYENNDIIVDGLVMTISSDQKAAQTTLDLIDWCTKELKVNTTCGLSNVSFGLPERLWINSSFLAMAISRGLSTAIINPSSDMMMNVIAATDALNSRDEKIKSYVSRFAQVSSKNTEIVKDESPAEAVHRAVVEGNDEAIDSLIDKAVESGLKPKEIVDNSMIPAINIVGDKYDKKEYFLPQLIMSADTMSKGFERLEPLLIKSEGKKESGPTVIMATVKGDIHDNGKNIVVLMLKNYGFNVIDIGKDVDAETIISEAKKNNANIIGLSALMTTTMTEMKTVIDTLRNHNLSIPVMIGGAVVDQSYADEIGAQGYAVDAMEAVKIAKSLVN